MIFGATCFLCHKPHINFSAEVLLNIIQRRIHSLNPLDDDPPKVNYSRTVCIPLRHFHPAPPPITPLRVFFGTAGMFRASSVPFSHCFLFWVLTFLHISHSYVLFYRYYRRMQKESLHIFCTKMHSAENQFFVILKWVKSITLIFYTIILPVMRLFNSAYLRNLANAAPANLDSPF